MSRFAHWLRLGHGRAAVELRRGGGSRDEVVSACISDERYDAQINESRGPYLLKLIQLSGEIEFYRDAINSALHAGPISEALFHVARHLGCSAAMRAAFVREGWTDVGAAEELVKLDGVSGLLLALENLRTEHEDDQAWQVRSLFRLLRPTSPPPECRPWLDVVKREAATWRNAAPNRPRQTESDLLRMAEEALNISDTKRQAELLAPFGHRHVFPLPPDGLLELFHQTTNERLALRVLNVLRKLTDPRIRSLAFNLLADPEDVFHHRGIGLLVRNGGRQDYPAVLSILRGTLDADDLHGMDLGFRDFFDAHPSRAAAPGLLHLYEHGPCTFCRTGIVRRLLRLSALPPAIHDESPYDAAEDTRTLVRRWPRF